MGAAIVAAWAQAPRFHGCFVCSRRPEGAGEHFRQSRVEFLKGIRSLLDHQIDQLSKEPNKGKRVVVE